MSVQENMRYFEKETPSIIKIKKNVIRIYQENGKIQIFPRVESAKYGVGKGVTICLECMDIRELSTLRDLVNQAIKTWLGEI
jgi:hypothetical protein